MTNEKSKDLDYWKSNAEEDYITTPISVLRYINELEQRVKSVDLANVGGNEVACCGNCHLPLDNIEYIPKVRIANKKYNP